MSGPLILSLCDLTGNWSRPYEEAGYRVVRVDLADGRDVRLLEHPGEPVRGILAAPPCTTFTKAAAWRWAAQGEAGLLGGLAVVDACLRLVATCRPDWWALENPAGRLRRWLGPPAWGFQPHWFGDLADSPEGEAYAILTYLWGNFTPPQPLWVGRDASVEVTAFGKKVGRKDRTSLLSSRERARRSATPTGFARAFYLSNP